jgi:hypothetical protein
LTFTLQQREDGNIGISNADANKVRFMEQWAMTACLHFFTNPHVTAVLMEWQLVVVKLSRLCELENCTRPTSTNLLRMETFTSTSMQSREDGISQPVIMAWVVVNLLTCGDLQTPYQSPEVGNKDSNNAGIRGSWN